MIDLIRILNKRKELLERSIKIAEREEKKLPEGRLRVSKTARQTRYYKMTDGSDKTGEYLSKKEQATIKLLAQKDYNKQFLKVATQELKLLEKWIIQYKNQVENVYNTLSPERKSLVTPYILSDDLVAKEWQSKKFKPNPYKLDNKIFDTRRGEKVRSKSEAIIADMLYEMGIPYHYECPVKMYNGEIRYPDFTLYKVKTREVIYFEHFGRMGDAGYRNDTREKMDLYRASGIYPGKNLMFTYETEENPLDISGVRKMLSEVFLD
ncbi:MAG: hypothetical protein K5739_01030 [Lachnospiraceae bacterium]|nr:hypothetical protein [Lachnospiraceae bacterium]